MTGIRIKMGSHLMPLSSSVSDPISIFVSILEYIHSVGRNQSFQRSNKVSARKKGSNREKQKVVFQKKQLTQYTWGGLLKKEFTEKTPASFFVKECSRAPRALATTLTTSTRMARHLMPLSSNKVRHYSSELWRVLGLADRMLGYVTVRSCGPVLSFFTLPLESSKVMLVFKKLLDEA